MESTLRLPMRNGGGMRLIWVACAISFLPVVACSAADKAAIKAAIDRGVRYLADTQSDNGTWNSLGHELGETSLAGMAMVAGGGEAYRAHVDAAAAAVRRLAAADTSTYNTSLAIMFLDRLGRPQDAQLLHELGIRLMAGQCRDGSWSYTVPAQVNGASSQPVGGASGDNSNTQFAALAAWISRRHGLANDAALQKLDQHFRNTVDSNHKGWGYIGQAHATPTMTCAGLVGLATHLGARQRAEDDDSRSPQGPAQGGRQPLGPAAADPTAKAALAALGKELRIANANAKATINQDLYFYWSLERVGVIYGVRDMGGIDWYRWGSDRLVKSQSNTGEWSGVGSKGWRFEANIGTSFAILFLCKANVAADLTAQVGQGGGSGSGGGVQEDPAPPGLGGGPQYLRRARKGDPPPGSQRANPGSETPEGKKPATTPGKNPQLGPGVLEPF